MRLTQPCVFVLSVQLIHEFRVLLLIGRTLVFPPAAVSSSMSINIQYKGADGRMRERQVELTFPGTNRTILRLVQAWWEVKVRLLCVKAMVQYS